MNEQLTPRALRAELEEYATVLKTELDSHKPRVYASIVWAYQDARVREAISTRLDAGQVLTASSQIVPDRALKRERVYFAFSPFGRLDTDIPGILVQLKDDNTVAEMVNPFDPQKDANLAAASAADTFPLSATRDTTDQVVPDQIAARQLAVRWTRFVDQPEFARIFASGGRGFFGGRFGNLSTGFNPEADSLCGGTPCLSTVASSPKSKEDPDQDTQGSYYDDCNPDPA